MSAVEEFEFSHCDIYNRCEQHITEQGGVVRVTGLDLAPRGTLARIKTELADASRQIARLQSGEIIESDLLTAVDMLALAEARIRELEAELAERRALDADVRALANYCWRGRGTLRSAIATAQRLLAATWMGGMGE